MTQQHFKFDAFDLSSESESARRSVAPARWDLLEKVRASLRDRAEAGSRDEVLQYAPVIVASYERAGVGPEERVTGGPYIPVKPPFIVEKLSFSAVSLFSWTTKMSAPSFSLPAGPPGTGGTCAAALVMTPEAKANSVYICDRCYAGKGSYLMYSRVALGQAIRLRWVNEILETGGISRLATALTEALASLHDEVTERRLAAKGISVRYVRIHDSGDFHRPDYYLAWRETAYALPMNKFWAPTRQWVFPKWRRIFENYPPPPNMTLRPSALLFGQKAPAVDGLAAGSTAASIEAPWGEIDGCRTWDCPAYRSENHSCASAGCRTCWDKPTVPVSYHPH